MDNARKRTDAILRDAEREIDRIYENSLILKIALRRYEKYMAKVDRITKSAYLDFIRSNDTDDREALKKLYTGKIEALTIHSREYNDIVDELTSVLAKVNQMALDEANDRMAEIYAVNYNQAVTDCRKAGIKINGKTENNR